MKIRFNVQNSTWFIYCLVLIFSFTSCSDDDNNEFINKGPQPLKNVTVENIGGGAKIYYDKPDIDVAFLIVKYENEDGDIEEIRYDIDKNLTFIEIKGLNTEKRKIELIARNLNGDYSESIEVEVEPLISPLIVYLDNILSTVEIKSVVGGISINYKDNEESKLLGFNLSYLDNGNWIDYEEVVRSKEESSTIIIAGVPYEEFKLFLTDESFGKSNTNEYSVTLIEEVELDKGLWSNPKFPGDNWIPQAAGVTDIEKLWDNEPLIGRFANNRTISHPHHFTIDLGEGQHLEISKIKIWHFNYEWHIYGAEHPKVIEVWVSNNPDPAEDEPSEGVWDNWDKIAEYESVKPSDDRKENLIYIQAGEEILIPQDKIKAYRYIRFRTIKTWTEVTVGRIALGQVSIWGVNPN